MPLGIPKVRFFGEDDPPSRKEDDRTPQEIQFNHFFEETTIPKPKRKNETPCTFPVLGSKKTKNNRMHEAPIMTLAKDNETGEDKEPENKDNKKKKETKEEVLDWADL